MKICHALTNEKVKPKFASQRMYRDFLLRGNTPASNQ